MPKFVKGQSGNPGGRPKGPTALSQLEDLLAQARADGRTALRTLLDKIVDQAIAGEPAQQKMILERIAPAALALQLDVPKEMMVRVIDHTGAGPVVQDRKA